MHDEVAAEKSPRNRTEIPKIELPKGGGAIRAIDEKLRANAANGTASFSIPLPFHAGPDAFSPALSLSYDSGTGIGLVRLGWSLDLPSISRGTGKKLPRYDDAHDSDNFQLTGFEDLVPRVLPSGEWDIEDAGGYRVQRYRPRIGGSFAVIETTRRVAHGVRRSATATRTREEASYKTPRFKRE